MQFVSRGRIKPTIDMSPLVDVVFLLIIFFTVSTTFREGTGLPVSLPEAGTATSTAAETVEITVGADGRMELQGKVYATIDDVRPVLARALEEGPSRRVIVRGDRTSSYGTIVQVMDLTRELGAEGMSLATRKSPAGDGAAGRE
jgi:biopolymer transport protein ExbD